VVMSRNWIPAIGKSGTVRISSLSSSRVIRKPAARSRSIVLA
jgi:hypothetical protein